MGHLAILDSKHLFQLIALFLQLPVLIFEVEFILIK